jgi:hypothetical protein
MAEVILLTCLQADMIISRMQLIQLLPEQKSGIAQEIRLFTQKDCPVYKP